MQFKNVKFYIITFVLILFITESYSVIEEVAHILFPYLPASKNYLNYYTIDTVNCFIGIIFFSIVFLIVGIKENKVISLSEDKVNHGMMTLIATVITFGMGGISSLWFDFAYGYLEDVNVISESLENFGQTWSDIDSSPYIFVFLSVVLLGPLVEELMFRGIIQKYARKYIPFPIPIIISALAFGIWHQEPVQVVYTVFMGLLIGIVYDYTKNLFFPIYMHILNNFLSTLPAPLQTDVNYSIIYALNKIMMLPTIFLSLYMFQQIYKREKTLRFEEQ